MLDGRKAERTTAGTRLKPSRWDRRAFLEKLLSTFSILSIEGKLKITAEMGGEVEKQSLCQRI